MTELTCKELVELVTDYVEAVLPPEERDRFERHLNACEGCRRYIEQMRQTITLTGALTAHDVSPQAGRKLLDVFRDWKTNAG